MTRVRLQIKCCLILLCSVLLARASDSPAPLWWKGNLHTHSLWSDGDDFPEMITGWYKKNGYHFLGISDHNVMQQGPRWLAIGTNKLRHDALEKYTARFGTNWVEVRGSESKVEVRLKPLSEYEALYQEAGRFLLIRSEEITDHFRTLPVHMNASNLRDYIPPQGGDSVREVMQNNVNAVLVQSRTLGLPILPHLNHPNFGWGVTAEDLAAVHGEKFFEVYNGHPDVHNTGDRQHASTEQLWDVALALRLVSNWPEPLYGLAVDDSHQYHQHGLKYSNSGRGWIMVRARFLTPEHLIAAMEDGDFYASSGVVLEDVQRSADSLTVLIQPQNGVSYRTEFVGTRRGFDRTSQPVRDDKGVELPVTRRYSSEVGEVLASVEGLRASYSFKGDELYVRARIISSADKPNPSRAGEKEMAWTQPVFARALTGGSSEPNGGK